jgi:hypothetical protein
VQNLHVADVSGEMIALSAERIDFDGEMCDTLRHEAKHLLRLFVQHFGVSSGLFQPLAHFGTQIPKLAAQIRHVAVHRGFERADSLGEPLDG